MTDNGENQNGQTRDDYQIPDDLLVVQLEVENVKRINAAAISPTDEMTKVGGFNENGKSTLLDSLEYTLCGGRALPVEPLRRGTKKGFSRVRIESRSTDFGLLAERQYTKKSDKLVVMLDGQDQPITAPQRMLDALYDANAAQPDDFLSLKPKDQLALLQELVGVSFDDLDSQRESLYKERTGVNGAAKLLEGQVAAMPKFDEVKEPVDTSALQAELKAAEQVNRQAEAAEHEIETLSAQSQQYDAELERLRARANEIKAAKEEIQTKMAEAASKAVEPVDTQTITDKLINAQELNDKVDANVRRREAEKQFRAKNAESMKLTLAIEKIVEEKEKRLAEAKFPVEGLSFGDEGVLLHGLPLEQASQEQQVITAAAIALAKRPKLRVILMRRGSLLDVQHQASLRAWAKKNKCQVILEVVGKDADCNVIIEDGYVEKGDTSES